MGALEVSVRDLLEQASDPARSPFDYVIVGCGAGGGPLAARLARAGKRVLVLEAGKDVANENAECGPVVPATALHAKLREAYEVPVYYAAASETDPMAWEFSVRHFADTAEQAQDPKYDRDMDPSVTPPPRWPNTGGKGGIFYPRASGVGGCTTHHAMIVVKPNDLDWERVAQLTGDASWQPDQMQGYFALLEKILYYKQYQSAFRKTLGRIAAWWRRVVAYINPSDVLDNGGHGSAGWQKTSFISPLLIATIVKTDWTFLRVLIGAILWILKKDRNWLHFLKAILTLTFVRFLDPNFRRDWPAAPNVNLKFIPLGTDGTRRVGVREWVLDTAQEHPGNLVIVTCALATRVLFEAGRRGDDERKKPVPRAVGVEVAIGEHLYQASPLSSAQASQNPPVRKFFVNRGGEVILSGGTYNTPQLLMLSGIGDQEELARHGIDGLRDPDGKRIDAEAIALPGVGKNLQDRYEVPVISEAKKIFKVLKDTSLQPNDPKDPQRQQWLEDGTGLYTTNGGAIAFLARSGHNSAAPLEPQRPEADLFVFGVPAAFRGYYWGWSSQVYSPVQLPPGTRVTDPYWNLWSWVILKAYTHNAGTVRLRSASPFEQLEIDTHYFARDPETGERTWGAQQDIEALRVAVEMVRDINSGISVFEREILPGRDVSDDQLEEWAHKTAWGHHANGTARMGSDPWRPYTSDLRDKDAVLDSRFKVHGVERLRVVDASIFPEIPGYFIVTPIFMAAEKAADVLLVDAATYPEQLEAAEAAAVRERREAAFVHPYAEVPGVEGGPVPAARLYGPEEATARAVEAGGPAAAAVTSSGAVTTPPPDPSELPPDTVGLAISGGGIRSATYGLGVLQALAKRGRLRSIDFLSSVSGGGYIGSFLGRLFTRVAPDVADKPAYVERVLRDDRSAQNDWLRTHANYLAGGGEQDWQTNLATIWRNLLAVQLVVATLAIALFSLLRWISGPEAAPFSVLGVPLSPWWWVPAVLVVVFALPFAYGYWLAPRGIAILPYAAFAIVLWVVLLAGAVAALGIPPLVAVGVGGLVILLLSWLWTELARLDMPAGTGRLEQGVILRSRLTRALGISVFLFVGAVGWVVLDTLARATAGAQSTSRPWIVVLAGLVLVILPLFRDRVTALTRKNEAGGGVGLIAFGLLTFLVFALDVIVHWAFDFDKTVGLWLALVAFAVSLVLGRDVGFLNLSSLQTVYAARIARTFLGASNPQRIYPSGAGTPTEVQVPHADDDIPFGDYHPENNGGPLHLIGVTVNETTDRVSGRHLKQDKGLPMCVGPEGISVGRRFHSLWLPDPLNPQNRISDTRPLVARNDPNAFHVLKQRGHETTWVEPLRLGQWIATSGAAFTTGQGRNTKLSLSLLLGLLNVRLGYWWDSRIRAGQRPGAFPPTFWRRLLALPSRIFRTQRMLLDEWRGYFEGPSVRYWYLSDGGHFEATGIYELVRRRLPFMIASDALYDPCYEFADVAQVMRLCQVDFGATFTWLDPVPLRAEGAVGWEAFEDGGRRVPAWIRAWLDPAAIGSWEEIKRNGPYAAALARITYADPWPRQANSRRDESWLLLLRAAVPPGMPLDVRCYAESNPAFPNDPTSNQFLTDQQWDAYRELGERTAETVLTEAPGGVSGTSSVR